ncbi:MAG: hypothetical protein U5L00_07230 [Desulfovermiculus sp.]|nr:hypothetical protein [Desulfovermiculus sp.]
MIYAPISPLKTLDDWHQVIDVLIKSGLANKRHDPLLHKFLKIAQEKHYPGPLQRYLLKYPKILQEAHKRVQENPLRPFPNEEELAEISGLISLGIVNEYGDCVGFNPGDFLRGFLVTGESGSGKSYPMLRMLKQIFSIPLEVRGYNVVIIQVAKHDADFLIKDFPHIKVIPYKHFYRNMFEVESWEDPVAKFNSIASIFASTNYLMTLTQPILNEAIQIAYEKYGLFTFKELVSLIGPALKSLGQKGYESKNAADKVALRLHEFSKIPQLNVRTGFRIEDFFTKEDIILNVMDETNEYVYATFITDLLMSSQRYNQKFPLVPNRLRTLNVIDECRAIFPKRTKSLDHNPDRLIERYITTHRADGLGLAALIQEIQAVATWLAENSSFLLSFPIAGEGLESLKKYQNLTDEQISFMFKLPSFGVGIFRDRRFDRPYLVQIPGDLQIESITEEEVEEMMRPYIQAKHEEFRNRQIKNEYQTIAEIPAPSAGIKEFLHRLVANYQTGVFEPLSTISKRLQIPSLNDIIIPYLIEENFIVLKQYRHEPKRGKYDFPVLTNQAQEQLKIPMNRRIHPDYFGHKLYAQRIADWWAGQGGKVFLEYQPSQALGGRIDIYIIDNNGVYGHAGQRIAFEVTLTVTAQNILPNILKCFENFNKEVDLICIVCEMKSDQDRAEAIINGSELNEDQRARVTVTTMYRFLEK